MTLKNGSSFIKPFGRILINHTAEIPGKLYTTLAFFPPVPGELIIRQAQGQARRSNVTEKFAKGGFYRLANSHQGLDGNDFFAALNFPNVFRIQVHNFRQVLLRQP